MSLQYLIGSKVCEQKIKNKKLAEAQIKGRAIAERRRTEKQKGVYLSRITVN
jgi:hypothetical protein